MAGGLLCLIMHITTRPSDLPLPCPHHQRPLPPLPTSSCLLLPTFNHCPLLHCSRLLSYTLLAHCTPFLFSTNHYNPILQHPPSVACPLHNPLLAACPPMMVMATQGSNQELLNHAEATSPPLHACSHEFPPTLSLSNVRVSLTLSPFLSSSPYRNAPKQHGKGSYHAKSVASWYHLQYQFSEPWFRLTRIKLAMGRENQSAIQTSMGPVRLRPTHIKTIDIQA